MTAERPQPTLRPIATPVPLAFAGLLIASVVLSGAELRWVPVSEHATVGWILLGLAGPLQLLAAFWGFLARSAAAATGAGVLAASWIAIALARIHAPAAAPGPSAGIGLMAVAAAAALLVPVLAEVRVGGLLPAAVLALAAARFVVTGVAGLTHAGAWAHASGWTGIAVAAAAFYGALALELEGTTQSAVLPTFRVGAARRSLEPGPADGQALASEPGVRKVL